METYSPKVNLTILNLNDDVLFYLFQQLGDRIFLTRSTIKNLSLVCKRFRNLLSDPEFSNLISTRREKIFGFKGEMYNELNQIYLHKFDPPIMVTEKSLQLLYAVCFASRTDLLKLVFFELPFKFDEKYLISVVEICNKLIPMCLNNKYFIPSVYAFNNQLSKMIDDWLEINLMLSSEEYKKNQKLMHILYYRVKNHYFSSRTGTADKLKMMLEEFNPSSVAKFGSKENFNYVYKKIIGISQFN